MTAGFFLDRDIFHGEQNMRPICLRAGHNGAIYFNIEPLAG